MESLDHSKPTRFPCGLALFLLSILITAYVSVLGLIPTTFFELLRSDFNAPLPIFAYVMISYFYSFALFLIPVSFLIDRYSTRWLISLGILITGVGALLLTNSSSLISATIARVLMGMGATVGFSYAVKCLSDWFKPRRFALLFVLFGSLQFSLTFLLVFLLTQLLEIASWQQVIFVYGLCSLPLALLSFLLHCKTIKHSPPHLPTANFEWWREICRLFDSSQVWFIGAGTGTFLGALILFLSKWCVPFFFSAYAASPKQAGFLLTLFFLGYLLGSFFFGYMSTSLERRKMFIPWGILSTLLMLIIIVYPPYLPITSIMPISFLLGFTGAVGLLGYVVIHEQNRPQLTATAVASLSTFFIITIALSDPVIHILLELELETKGTLGYNLQNLQVPIFRIPIYLAFSLFFSLFIKETYAKQRS